MDSHGLPVFSPSRRGIAAGPLDAHRRPLCRVCSAGRDIGNRTCRAACGVARVDAPRGLGRGGFEMAKHLAGTQRKLADAGFAEALRHTHRHGGDGRLLRISAHSRHERPPPPAHGRAPVFPRAAVGALLRGSVNYGDLDFSHVAGRIIFEFGASRPRRTPQRA